MISVRAFILALPLLVFPVAGLAAPVAVQNLRLWQAPDHTRLVLDLSGPAEHRLKRLEGPDRIIIEIDSARLQDGLAPLDVGQSYISAVRAAEPGTGPLQITLELRRPVRPQGFMLKPFGQYGHRLVVDLYDEAVAEVAPTPEARAAPPARPVLRPKDLVVAIDAGHGGEDPGAIGRRYRTREKDVTLAIARELHKLVNAASGMKAVLIRDGDYFIKLHKRRDKAERHNADVFVSIHADSMPGKRAKQVRGSSVYALSHRGASNEVAKALADSENASDWIGGVDPREVDRDVRTLLGDLTREATITDSSRLGGDILGGLRIAGPLHSAKVAQAGFAVLKQPMPAILVETAFISNAEDERLLRNPAHQKRIAEGIFRGLKQATPWILARRDAGGSLTQVTAAPPVTPAPIVPTAGAREHVVKPGETLTAIARLYDTHIDVLRFLNDIQGDELTVGSRLHIPSRRSGL